MSTSLSLKLNFKDDLEEMKKLAALVRTLNASGHNPATSGNYSLRSKQCAAHALVSESGIDKSLFHEDNFLLVNQETGLLHPSLASSGRKSSDETDIHLSIYKATKAGCVLHSHLLESILFADLHPSQTSAEVAGLELLKGFKGIKSHEQKVTIPLFDNSQDIKALSKDILLAISDRISYGFLLRGHGLYVWGDTVKDAKRHLEVFEYLFRYYIAKRKLV